MRSNDRESGHPWLLPARLDTESNRGISAFIRQTRPSAHDDVSTELNLAIQGLSGVSTFCPDVHAYAYVAAHDAHGRIFALACGQSHIGVRVGHASVSAAIADGATAAREIGNDWVWFRLFSARETVKAARSGLGGWCRKAWLLAKDQ